MIHLVGKPCDICGKMEFIQEVKDFVVCECCMSVYRDDGSLRLVSVGSYEKLEKSINLLKVKNEELEAENKQIRITRTIIQFQKNKEFYEISLFIRGHKFDFSHKNWGCVADKLMLHEIPANKLDEMINYYIAQGHDICLKDGK